ncbi:MAG: hypothetical protein EOM20_12065 [Spartobacteria bacterium]|nr:hypothetical protein [Spartobacteria bacterium]
MKYTWSRAHACIGLFLLLAGAGAVAEPLPDEEAIFDAVRARFIPDKPTISVEYAVDYRLLFLKLFHIANARVDTTEGYWVYAGTQEKAAVCLVEMYLTSHTDERDPERGWIYLKNHIMTVMTMPDLDSIIFIKHLDERIDPPFKSAKRTKTLHVYDLESGMLNYRLYDYLSDTLSTNLTGSFDLAKQGADISNILKIMSGIYYGKEELIHPDTDFRLHMSVDDGVIIPLVLDTRPDTTPIKLFGSRMDALRVKIEPERGAQVRNRKEFIIWAASLQDVARQADDLHLEQLAIKVPDWSMVPLVIDHGLSLGYIRCGLTGIHATAPEMTPEPPLE